MCADGWSRKTVAHGGLGVMGLAIGDPWFKHGEGLWTHTSLMDMIMSVSGVLVRVCSPLQTHK